MDDPNKKESVADVLARMQGELSFNVHDFMDPSEAVKVREPESPKPLPRKTTEQRAMDLVSSAESAVNANEDQQGDVGDYMSSLLQRYGNSDEAPAAAATPALAKETKPEPAEEKLPKAEKRPASPLPTVENFEDLPANIPQLLNHHEYLPQKKAPEEQASIAAMRELAVHSARKAIQDSALRQRGLDASFRLSLGVGCALLAIGSFFLAEVIFTIIGMLGIASVVGATAFFLNWQSTIRQKP